MSASDPSAADRPDLRDLSGLLVLVGAGKMGGALLDGWLRLGLNPANVAVVEPQPSPQIAALADRGVQLRPDTARTARRCRRRHRGKAANRRRSRACASADDRRVHACRVDHGRPDAAIPGRGAQQRRAPWCAPCRIRPPRSAAASPSPWRLAQTKSSASLRIAFLPATGAVEWVDDEALMDAVTAVSGSGPAYVFLLAETLAQAAVAAGLPPRWRKNSRAKPLRVPASCSSAQRLTAATLRENVTSPGGTTAAALKVLMGPNGLGPLMKEAVAAATRRSRELAG